MATPMASPPRSPIRSPGFSSPLPAEAPKEGVVARFFIAPLTFISFLISLEIIDSRNHRVRSHEHATAHPEPVGIYQHIKYYLHLIIYKSVPSSPYAYVKSLKAPDKVHVTGAQEEESDKEPWHWHTKQRHMMKAEMEEAFRVRKWVTVLLFAAAVAGLVVGGMMWRWMGYLLGLGGRVRLFAWDLMDELHKG